MRGSHSLLKRKLCRLFYLSFTFVGVFLLVIPLSTGAVYSAQVTLRWDANAPSDQVTSYSIHYKTGSFGPPYDGWGASEGDSPIVVSVEALSDPDNPQYTIQGLSDNETYYLAITASNAYGQSGYSNEVSFIKESPGGIGNDFSDITLFWRVDQTNGNFSGTNSTDCGGSGTGEDCSKGDDTATANASVAITGTAALKGSYGIESDAANEWYQLDASAGLINPNTGTLCFRAYITKWVNWENCSNSQILPILVGFG